jgi:uncharacterized membrane protein YsdA (DUF1294 family)
MIPWILLVQLVLSLVTLAAYGFDKRRAKRGGRRIPERTLHLLELAGGWPGALAGQRLFRHKSRKLSFRVVLWGIVALHLAAWGAFGAYRLGWLEI